MELGAASHKPLIRNPISECLDIHIQNCQGIGNLDTYESQFFGELLKKIVVPKPSTGC